MLKGAIYISLGAIRNKGTKVESSGIKSATRGTEASPNAPLMLYKKI